MLSKALTTQSRLSQKASSKVSSVSGPTPERCKDSTEGPSIVRTTYSLPMNIGMWAVLEAWIPGNGP